MEHGVVSFILLRRRDRVVAEAAPVGDKHVLNLVINLLFFFENWHIGKLPEAFKILLFIFVVKNFADIVAKVEIHIASCLLVLLRREANHLVREIPLLSSQTSKTILSTEERLIWGHFTVIFDVCLNNIRRVYPLHPLLPWKGISAARTVGALVGAGVKDFLDSPLPDLIEHLVPTRLLNIELIIEQHIDVVLFRRPHGLLDAN